MKDKTMKIYDISQEVFSCAVYPGDPAPEKKTLYSTAAPLNLGGTDGAPAGHT